MALIETIHAAFVAIEHREKFLRILKWAVAGALVLFFILYIIFAAAIAVFQGFGKTAENPATSNPTEFTQFQDFSYKTYGGNNWYEFKHPYDFPTLGALTQGTLSDASKDGLPHVAWDIADRVSRQTEVRAFADGVVAAVNSNILYNTTRRWKFCGNGTGICWYQVTQAANIQIGCGYEVIIAHADSLNTQYCHLAGQPSVKVGDTITKGQVFGYQGSTGWATGKHLHFALWRDNQPIDPSYAFSQTSLSNWGQ